MEILANSEQSVTAITNWQQQLKSSLRSVESLLLALGLESAIGELPAEALDFSTFVPQPYLNRIRKRDLADPLLRQVLPVAAEGESPPHFLKDPLGEQAATVRDGLIQKYQKRVLVVASAVCAINCRYCFRRHFPYETAAQGTQRWQQIIAAIELDSSLNEVILSGGDPLMISDEKLSDILTKIADIDHIDRVRIHTRLPIVIPQRITDQLLAALSTFRESRSGRQVIVVVHCNHANEIDAEVCRSLELLRKSVTQVLNQSVLLRGVNDDVEVLIDLSERLLQAGAMPYYLHQLDPIVGAAHFEVPISQGCDLISAMRARLPGFAVPRYVQEIAGEPSKTVLA